MQYRADLGTAEVEGTSPSGPVLQIGNCSQDTTVAARLPEPCPTHPSPLPKFGASTDNPKTLVTRATSLRVGRNTIVVRVALSGTSKQWELSAAANGKAVTGTATLAGGVKVSLTSFNPPSNLVASRVTIDAGELASGEGKGWMH